MSEKNSLNNMHRLSISLKTIQEKVLFSARFGLNDMKVEVDENCALSQTPESTCHSQGMGSVSTLESDVSVSERLGTHVPDTFIVPEVYSEPIDEVILLTDSGFWILSSTTQIEEKSSCHSHLCCNKRISGTKRQRNCYFSDSNESFWILSQTTKRI